MTNRDNPIQDTVGKEIVDVKYVGDYYHPFIITLDDGTEIYVGGVK